MRLLFALLIGSVLLSSCVQKKKEAVQPLDTSSLVHQVTVEEVIQTSTYTYLKVSENSQEFWLAVNRQEVEVGEKYYYESALEMKDFESKALGRVFDSIYFVQKFSQQPITSNNPVAGKQSPQGKALEDFNEGIQINPVDGGVSIADLYASKSDFSGQQVTVKGQVVKVNKNIMSRNWLHIQDGTKHGENYDLTITSNEVAEVGDVIVVEGTVTLDKDFGAGYFYELIMEDGKILP
ncbi:GW dipeptide domain-containing protein [Sunxiuqinia dokdonensis]|uniref:GW domain-containing protein n=1 Tax=Sunxiuqinia dokdonensis TaxID=1409788 RepID=A0A0L8V6Z8_9BACT|nr:GW dipeptide domain-containing protein [Sunxiuqinia dokdonensis]KOH44209.1 hypothetical protein NC99_30150 [Sunxiuqinia dokdonensis]